MPVGGTTVGPIEPGVRDALAEYRDQEGYRNYNEAVKSLLDSADHEI